MSDNVLTLQKLPLVYKMTYIGINGLIDRILKN